MIFSHMPKGIFHILNYLFCVLCISASGTDRFGCATLLSKRFDWWGLKYSDELESGLCSPGVWVRGLTELLLCSFVFHSGCHLASLKITLSMVQRGIGMFLLQSPVESKASFNKNFHFSKHVLCARHCYKCFTCFI